MRPGPTTWSAPADWRLHQASAAPPLLPYADRTWPIAGHRHVLGQATARSECHPRLEQAAADHNRLEGAISHWPRLMTVAAPELQVDRFNWLAGLANSFRFLFAATLAYELATADAAWQALAARRHQHAVRLAEMLAELADGGLERRDDRLVATAAGLYAPFQSPLDGAELEVQLPIANAGQLAVQLIANDRPAVWLVVPSRRDTADTVQPFYAVADVGAADLPAALFGDLKPYLTREPLPADFRSALITQLKQRLLA